jgi:hypothetical protein
MAESDRDFFINEGFEAFYELPPVFPDCVFVINDLQHYPYLR